MSIISQGVLGGFTGKTGPVIGSSWRGKPVMKAKPIFKKNRKFSQSQLDQQVKFKLMSDFLRQIDFLLNFTYRKKDITRSGYQEAFSANLENAFRYEDGVPFIDYEKIKLSHGGIPMSTKVTCTAEPGSMLKLSWNLHVQENGKTSDADRAVAVVYCPDDKEFLISNFNTRRSNLELLIDAAMFGASVVHVWFFFLSDDEKRVSNTKYIGTVTISS